MIVDIRPAATTDLTAISNLCAARAAYERGECDAVGSDDKLAAALAESTPRVEILLAVSDSAPVGNASSTREFSTWQARDYLHLNCMFVLEVMRGRRIGRQLFDAVRAEVKLAGLRLIQWQTPDWNHDAIRFYRGFGAEELSKMRLSLDI